MYYYVLCIDIESVRQDKDIIFFVNSLLLNQWNCFIGFPHAYLWMTKYFQFEKHTKLSPICFQIQSRNIDNLGI